MTNDEEIVIRVLDFKMSPDVEIYVKTLSKKGVLEKFSKQADLMSKR